MAPPVRFPVRFTGANRAMGVLGIDRATARVAIDEAQLHVHMGWAFELHVPLADVHAATLDHDRVTGWGVHGWRGQWLVNGSSSGIVRLELDPPARARTLCFTVEVRVLRVSVDDPDGLLDAVGATPEGYASA